MWYSLLRKACWNKFSNLGTKLGNILIFCCRVIKFQPLGLPFFWKEITYISNGMIYKYTCNFMTSYPLSIVNSKGSKGTSRDLSYCWVILLDNAHQGAEITCNYTIDLVVQNMETILWRLWSQKELLWKIRIYQNKLH